VNIVRIIPSFIEAKTVGGYTVDVLPHLGEPWLFRYRHVDLPADEIVNDRGQWNDRKATAVYNRGGV